MNNNNSNNNNNNIIEPLLFCPSPRDLPEFYHEFNKFAHYDKYFVRYTKPETKAYDLARDVFLENKQYTHLVICPDDLIIKREHVNQLYLDLVYMQTLGIDQSVCIGGFCNLNTTDKKDLSNICIERVNIDPYPDRRYNFATLKELRDLRVKHKMRYIPVGFSGFPLMAVPRTILQEFEFRNDSEDGWQDYGCCVDVMFCHDVYEHGFKVLCDLDLEMHHMKIDDNQVKNFYVGIKDPKRYFEYKIN